MDQAPWKVGIRGCLSHSRETVTYKDAQIEKTDTSFYTESNVRTSKVEDEIQLGEQISDLTTKEKKSKLLVFYRQTGESKIPASLNVPCHS